MHGLKQKKPLTNQRLFSNEVAEGQGFEPWVGYSPTPVFKTGAFNRSAIPPAYGCIYYQLFFLSQRLLVQT